MQTIRHFATDVAQSHIELPTKLPDTTIPSAASPVRHFPYRRPCLFCSPILFI